MKIREVCHQAIRIPLIRPLSHSRKTFRKTESLLILVNIDGSYGVGECAPRPYVTGETIESTTSLLESFLKRYLIGFSFEKLEEVEPYLDNLIKGNNALKAGLEIAIFDSVGKLLNKPVYELLFSKTARQTFRINGGVPFFTSKQETLSWIKRFYDQGVRNFKIKVGKDVEDDLHRLRYIKDRFPDIRLRIDVNGIWSLAEGIEYLSKIENYQVFLVEEPITGNDFRDLKLLKEKVKIPIMVDESLVTLNDAVALVELGACSWFNIRLSKNGGFFKAKRILELGTKAGIKTQIGSHFGESDVLEAARRHFAFGAPGIDSFEGGTIMLFKEHVTREPLGFNDDLLARIDSIDAPGLGVNLREKYFKKFS